MDRQDVSVKLGRMVGSRVLGTLRNVVEVWVAVLLYEDRVRCYIVKECCRRRR